MNTRQPVTIAAEHADHVIGMYMHGITDADVAAYLGVNTNALIRYLKRRENLVFKQKIEKAKVIAKTAIRNALYQKAKDGDLSAIKFWLLNCDDSKAWKFEGKNGTDEKPSVEFSVEHMSQKELVNYITGKIKEGIVPVQLSAPDMSIEASYTIEPESSESSEPQEKPTE